MTRRKQEKAQSLGEYFPKRNSDEMGSQSKTGELFRSFSKNKIFLQERMAQAGLRKERMIWKNSAIEDQNKNYGKFDA